MLVPGKRCEMNKKAQSFSLREKLRFVFSLKAPDTAGAFLTLILCVDSRE